LAPHPLKRVEQPKLPPPSKGARSQGSPLKRSKEPRLLLEERSEVSPPQRPEGLGAPGREMRTLPSSKGERSRSSSLRRGKGAIKRGKQPEIVNLMIASSEHWDESVEAESVRRLRTRQVQGSNCCLSSVRNDQEPSELIDSRSRPS
jgi:hypothetical protein